MLELVGGLSMFSACWNFSFCVPVNLKIARKVWKTASIAAISTSVLLAWRILVWVSFEISMVAIITVAHKTISATKIHGKGCPRRREK
jgi:hypothetical protein